MKKNLITYVITTIALSCFNHLTAQLLAGYVYEQNSGKKPVPAALLRALSANQVASGTNGQYRLQFQDGRPGKSVFLSVQKEAWVVTNEAQLDVNLPQDPQTYQHTIVMCPQKVWEQQKAKFKAVAENFLNKSFDQKLAALNKKNNNTQDSIAVLYQQLATQQKAMEELASSLSSINLDEVSEKERLAYRLFEEGKIEECIRVRESMNSEAGLKAATQKKQQIDKRLQALDSASIINQAELNSYRRNIREEAHLAMLQLDVIAADKKLSFLADQDTTEFTSLYDYTGFLQQQKQFNKSIIYGLKALRQARTDIQRCKAQNTLSALYRSMLDYSSAHKMLQDAIAITTLMADSISVYSASFLAVTQNNLGLLYKAETNYTAAAKALHTVLEIRKRQALIDPAAFEPCLATAQLNLGALYTDNEEDAAAEKIYQEAAIIYQRLAGKAPAVYDPMVATIQNNLGLAYFHQKKYTAADSAYVAAIQISRRLALKNPDAYLPDVAETCLRLGVLYRTVADYAIADSALQEALQIRTRLAAEQPSVYTSCVAEVKMNIGLLNWAKGNYDVAEKILDEAQLAYEQLSKKNPDTYLPVLADLQNNLGELYTIRKDTAAASEAYAKALTIHRQLAKNNPVVYAPLLTNMLYKVAKHSKMKADYTEAISLLTEARLLHRQSAKDTAAIYRHNRLLVETELAAVYLKTKDTTAAIAVYKEAIQEQGTEIPNPETADLQLKIGRLYRNQNPIAAEDAFSKAASAYQLLMNTSTGQYESAFCRCVVNLGELYQAYYLPQNLAAYFPLLAAANTVSDKGMDSTVSNRLVKLSKFFADDCAEIRMLQNQLKRTADVGKKLRFQQQIVAKRKALIDGGKEAYRADLAKDFTSLSWYQLLNRQFAEAEETARQAEAALASSTSSLQAKEYLAPALLLQDRWAEAEKIYKTCKAIPYTTAGKSASGFFSDLFLKDLDELEKVGISHKNISKARLLLSEKDSTVPIH